MTQSGRQPSTRKERRAAERAAQRNPVAAASTRPSPLSSPVVLITIGVVIAGLVLLVLILTNRSSGHGPIRTVEHGTPVDLRDGRSLGRADAPVQIVMFADPQCPVCGRFTRELEPLLVAKYLKDGTARLTYKDFVFIGKESQDAAVGMRAAEQLAGKFWDYHDIVYENQSGENQGAFTRDRLAQMATAIGLDAAAFTPLLDDPDLIAAMRAEVAEGHELGISSTPTLIVNGQVRPGLPSWEELSAMIDAAAAQAGPASPAPTAAATTPAATAVPTPTTPASPAPALVTAPPSATAP